MISRTTRFVSISLIWVLIGISMVWADRAGLDYSFIAYDDGDEKNITCDFCGYSFSDGISYFSPISMDLLGKSVTLYFRKKGKQDNEGGIIYKLRPVSSKNLEFEVDYYSPAHVREGQTIRLRGTNFKIKITDIFGKGCPFGHGC